MPYKNLEDKNVNQRKYRTQLVVREKRTVERRTAKQARKELVLARKTAPCTLCDMMYPPRAMQFHHRDRTTKVTEINNLVKSGTMSQLLEELDKCDLYCACCHAMIES